jgi:thiol-disulfide isomerase/thioredoxin
VELLGSAADVKPSRVALVLLALAGLTVAVVLATRRSGEDGDDWGRPTPAPTPAFSGLSVRAAREQAEAEGRALIIDTTADWCPPCKAMEAKTWRDPRVLDWVAAHAVVVQLDVDRFTEVARALGIRAMPTLILERDGQEVDRSTGFMSADDLLRWAGHERSAEPSLTADQLASEMRYPSIPDRGSPKVYERLGFAQEELEGGGFDQALAEMEWLWAHGVREQPSFQMARWSALPKLMFLRLLEVAQREVDSDRVGSGVWLDWMVLCDVTGQTDRVLEWYTRQREPDGSIDDGRYWRCPWIPDSIFQALIDRHEFAEAGRVYRRPTAVLQRRLDLIGMAGAMSAESGGAGLALGAAFLAAGGSGAGDALRD